LSKELNTQIDGHYILIYLPKGELMINLSDYFPEQFKTRLVLINHQSANQRITLNYAPMANGITITDGFHSHIFIALGIKTIKSLIDRIMEAYEED